MTTNEAIHKLCRWAYDQVGYREGADNYNRYAENKWVVDALGWDPQNQPWCAVFVVAAFVENFGLYAGCHMMYGCSALCRAQAQYYQENAAYYPTPEKGDQIFFLVFGEINHTGIVVDVSGSTITTIEGNTSDGVYERTYYINDPTIAGYGRPNWAIVADDPGEEDPGDPDEPEEPQDEEMTADGICGPITWKALAPFLPLLMEGSIGTEVKTLQAALNRAGAKIDVDGEFGPKTKRALMEFQESV